jgi:hypothetical protein
VTPDNVCFSPIALQFLDALGHAAEIKLSPCEFGGVSVLPKFHRETLPQRKGFHRKTLSRARTLAQCEGIPKSEGSILPLWEYAPKPLAAPEE